MKYLVEVTTPLPPDIDLAAERLAEMFSIQSDQVRALLDRAPGVVTRPLDEDEANRVIDTFTEAGIWARVLPYDAAVPTMLDQVLDAAGSEPVGAVHRRRGAAGVSTSVIVPTEPGRGGEIHPEDTDSVPSAAEGAEAPEDAPPEAEGRDPAQPGLDGHGLERSDVTCNGYAVPESTREGQVLPSEGSASAEPAVDAAPEATVPPTVADLRVDEDAQFDVQAFTQALLAEHGLDESLLEGLDTEAEAFDLRDRGERLSDEMPVTETDARARHSPFLTRVEVPVEHERGVIAMPIETESDEPTAFVREPDTAPQDVRGEPVSSGKGLRFKLMLAALVPALLTAAFALAAVALTVRPTLRFQQIDGASSAAIAFASGLSTRLVDAAFDSPAAAAELQRAALEARSALLADGIDFLLVIDPQGAPLAGWSAISSDPQVVALAVAPVAASALETMFGAPVTVRGIPSDAPSSVTPGQVAAAPLLVQGSAIGAVLVGSDLGGVDRRSLTVLLIALVAVLIPLLIAFVVSSALSGSLLHNLHYLTRSADRISRGKLARSVELDTGDELGELAKAIERMRISLQEGMERLRKRRQ